MKGIVSFLPAIALLFLFTPSGQGSATDSLLKVLDHSKADTNKVKALYQLSQEYQGSGDYGNAMFRGKEALDLARQLHWKKGEALANNNVGVVYMYKGDYPSALKYYALSLELYQQITLDSSQALAGKRGASAAYNNMGNVCWNQGNLPDALKNYFASLKIREELGDKKGMAASYGNIGLVYHDQGNETDALRYEQMDIDIAEKIGNKRLLSNAYNTLGLIYETLKDFPRALKNHLASLQMEQEMGNKPGMADSYNNIGTIYYYQGNFEEAMKKYNEALSLSKEIGDDDGIASSYIDMSAVCIKQKKPLDAKKYLNEALRLSLAIGSKYYIKECYANLAEADSLQGDYRQALRDYRQKIVYKDSLLNEENTRKTVQASMQYEFDKQQAADSIRNAERVKQEILRHEQEIAQQRVYTIGGAIGFLLMMVVAGVSFRAYRNKQKANEVISHQKILVEEKQKEILDSIHYARRIQRSLLPTETYIYRSLQRLTRK